MNVQHAAGAIGRDDDKAVVIPEGCTAHRELPDCRTVDRPLVTSANQPGLPRAVPGIDPFEPVVDRADSAMGPDRSKERAVGDFLDPGIDRRRTILRPVRPPAPALRVGVQAIALKMQQRQLGGGRSVVASQWLIANVVDQGIGNAQHRHEVVNAPVLRQASAHRLNPPAGVFSIEV